MYGHAHVAQRVFLVLAGVASTSGCFMGDPPPDPEVQPLEIIAGNPDPDVGPCLLNVDEVGAGIHDVGPVSMDGEATVRIVDPSGAVAECILADGTHTTMLRVVPARPGYEEDSPG